MADKRILCAFGIDLDAVGGWLGSYGGEDSPDDISRGLFAGEVGTLRLLKLFDNLGVQTTWFIPVYILEGEVNIKIGEQTIRGTVGSFVLIPRGTVRTFWNAGPNACQAFDYLLSARNRAGFC